MRAGEQIPLDDARRRYVQALIGLRPPTSNYIAPSRTEPATSTAGPLADFIGAENHLLVIGPGGLGKTTMLKQAAAEGGQRATENRHTAVFVYLRLGGVDAADGALDGLFNALAQAAHLETNAFKRCWRGGVRPIVLLLDGINEVQRSFDETFADGVWSLLRAASARHCCVITSRPGHKLELLVTGADESHRLRLADMREFGPSQVDEYLSAQGRSELKERFSEPIRALANNPFLLWAITRTLAMSQDIRNRGSLFRALIDRYIFDTRERSKRPRPPTDYNYQLVKKPVLAALALKMVDEGATDLSEGATLTPVLVQLREIAKQAENRLQPFEAATFMPGDYSAAALVRECVDNGVLVVESGKVRFMHESVQEYFAASALPTDAVDEIMKRLPSANLAHVDARGPMFEAAVTWAGLAGPERVGAIVAAIKEPHPLLAAALAVEAELPSYQVRPLREHLLALTYSGHEQRQRLALLGLLMIPSDDPAVVERLIHLMLEVGERSRLAMDTLKAAPTPSVIDAVVKSWLATPEEDLDTDDRVQLLSHLVEDHARVIGELLVNLWIAGRDDRVIRLAAALDSGVGFFPRERTVIHDVLVTVSTETELAGDSERSAAIDTFRQRMEQTVIPKVTFAARISARFERISEFHKELERIAESIGSQSDDVLERILRNGTSAERRVALNTLAARGAPAAVIPALDAALDDDNLSAPFAMLETLPRALVQQRLADRIVTLESSARVRAQVLGILLSDSPDPTELERIFESQSEDVRALAAKAAERSLPNATPVLLRQLGREAAEEVIDALIHTLALSHEPAVLEHLLRLLFDRRGRSTWRSGSGELVKDEGRSLTDDKWANVIHGALANTSAATATLDRAEQLLHSDDVDTASAAVHESRRWLPAPRAIAMLRKAMSHPHIEVARWAKWSMACAGDPDGWQLLLQAELDTPPDFVGFAQDAARRLEEASLEPSVRARLTAGTEQVLRPALQSADATRRAMAIALAARMPGALVAGDWQREVADAAEQLIQAHERKDRSSALRGLLRFASAGKARLLDVLLTDSNDQVIAHAYHLLGDEAHTRLDVELQQAVQAGNCSRAIRLAALVRKLTTKEQAQTIEQVVRPWLDALDAAQVAGALMAVVMLHADDAATDDVTALVTHVKTAFDRHGFTAVWDHLSLAARALDEKDRGFVYRLLGEFGDRPADRDQLLALAEQLWPLDLEVLGLHIVADVRRGELDRAARRLDSVAAQFADQLNPAWLAERYAELGRFADAVVHYKRHASANPDNESSHFGVGWYAFLAGDYTVSIAATRQALKLKPLWPSAEFNLGLALFAANDVSAAEAAYKRGIALAKRKPPEEARISLQEALTDLAQDIRLPAETAAAVEGVRQRLQDELDRRS